MDSRPQISIKEQVRKLWEECFDDSPEFTDFYFDKRYSDDINIGLTENGIMVSALQMIPYPMTVWNNVISTSYISGACTSYKYRNRGLMRRLLKLTHERMYADGVILSTLIPAEDWLVGFYEKSGYSRCFAYERKTLKKNAAIKSLNIEITKTLEYSDEVYRFFNEEMMKRENCVQHSNKDFKVLMADLAIENGNLYVAREDGRIKGLAFVITYSDTLYLKELLAVSNDVEQSLVNAICNDYNVEALELSVPAVSSPIHRGMARVINVKAMLDIYAKQYTHKEMYIEVKDNEIESNNGFYNIFLGECDCNIVDGKEYKKYSIKDLTSMLFDNEYPFMSLMLD